ncbi:hypothetical protein GN956_G6897 [Arapaima gigas]
MCVLSRQSPPEPPSQNHRTVQCLGHPHYSWPPMEASGTESETSAQGREHEPRTRLTIPADLPRLAQTGST